MVSGGEKVGVELDLGRRDPFFFDPLWESYGADLLAEADYPIAEDG